MSTVKLSDNAYGKIILHSAKYPWANIFGLLLGPADGTNEIIDAIPVFHSPILAPVLEVALLLTTQHCVQNKLKIMGGYYCGEDSTVAEKAVQQFCAKLKVPSLLLIMDKEKLAAESSPFEVVASSLLKNAKLQLTASAAKDASRLLKEKRETKLVDVEDSLEDPTLDFRNTSLLA